jgi:hypothetical protein
MATRRVRTPVAPTEEQQRHAELISGAQRLRGTSGSLAGPIQPWFVPPKAELDGDELVYEWVVEEAGPDGTTTVISRQEAPPASREMLAAFLDLADAEPQEIRDFARRWGPLGLDEEGHPRPGDPTRERLDHWRHWARLARSIVRAAAARRGGRDIPGTDRAVMMAADARVPWPRDPEYPPTDHDEDRRTTPLHPASLWGVRVRSFRPEEIEHLAPDLLDALIDASQWDQSQPLPEDYPSWHDAENVAHLVTGWLRLGWVAPVVSYDADHERFVFLTACPTLSLVSG